MANAIFINIGIAEQSASINSQGSMLTFLDSIDRSLFLILNTIIAHPVLDSVFRNGTNAQFWIVPGIAAIILFVLKKKQEALIILGVGIILVAITDSFTAQILKPFFGRHRPCHPEEFVAGGRFLCGMKGTLSMPSVHAANIFAQATMLTFFYPRWKWIYISFALFIGYSRVYVGVHFPGDVFVGACEGILIALFIITLFKTVKRRIQMRRKKNNDILKPVGST